MKQILITGATGGLGRAVVSDALARGWHVTGLHGSNTARAREMSDRHSATRERLQLLASDLTDPESTATTARALAAAHPWDALLHLAAPPLDLSPFSKQDVDLFERNWRTMLPPAVILSQALLPGMRLRRHGALVFCLSAVTLAKSPKGMSAYTSAKYALWGLARSIAAECAGSGIQVTCFSPGPMDTDLLRHLPEIARRQLRDHGGKGTFLDPAVVARAMLDTVENPDSSLQGGNLPILSVS